ncbi:MAG: type I-U CRISPR-associated helicase/endonuclease Cas3 [Verrucomicrobia bacterium]|nr:type I-U CRISPR-associated helicase/endonuclease Cas3 [Verrucomicrobiota bacterium]
MSAFPSFTAFFCALWGKDPFPWQTMLADWAATKGFPDAIDLPTASGKTACLDIAVWALAKQAGEANRSIPRRIWFVVDRRIVVDEAYDRAETIATKLADDNASEALRAVAERLVTLRGLDSKRRPLAVGRLRGGVLRDDRWARIPSQAAIITSTVHQLGSRLLFRGYGYSALTAPLFAGLAGNDSLILLDEAHCTQPFLQTLRAVKMFRSAKWSLVPNPTPFHVAVLSATPPGEDDGEKLETFPPNEDEREQALNHPVLQARLTASKRAVLEAVKDEEELMEKIADAAEEFARSGTLRVGVIVNRVVRAMAIAATLRTKSRERISDGEPPTFDVELLTGRIRPVERDLLVGERLSPFFHSSPKRDPDRPSVLISTQCLEVGADFSFDALVTECASLDALRQRFGRLARLGKEFLWEKAESKKTGEQRVVNFGFEALRALLPPPDSDELRDMLAPSPDAPILLPAHLDLLCQTAPRPHPDPDIGIFLHGKGRHAAEVRVTFRCDFDPLRPQDWPEIASLCPPVASEMFSVPLHRFRQWLRDHESSDATGDVESERDEAEGGLSKRTSTVKFLLCCGREKSKVSSNPADIFPNSVIIFPSPRDERGLADVRKLGQALCEQGFGSQKVDVWELALQRAGKTPALRLNREVLSPWLAGCPPLRALVALLENSEPTRTERDEAIAAILEWMPAAETDSALPIWLRELFTATRDYYVSDIARHPGGGIILRAKKRNLTQDETDYFSDEDDIPSEALAEVLLTAHCAQVATIAGKLAHACLGEAAVTAAKAAGDWHDAGKLDPRFQVMLRGGAPAEDTAQSLAKSPRKPRSREQTQVIREAAGLPHDFRHEMLSTQLAERLCRLRLSSADRELLLHLIASHHGHARPFAPVCEDDAPPAIEGQLDFGTLNLSTTERRALTAPHRLASGITDRFWALIRRHGWWGLAYHEAILRLADWYASEHPQSAENPPHP